VALAVVCAPGVGAAQPPSAAPGDPAAGARLFRERGCSDCHAADLARFRDHPRTLPALAAAMWNHFPAMAERIRTGRMKTPYFTGSEMRHLVTFLYSASPDRRPADDPRLLGDAGDPGRGRQVVMAKGCLECHSIVPPAGKRAGSLAGLKGLESPWTVVAHMWNHAFLMELETQARGGPWVPMSEAEMADLVAYLQSLMRAR
jgi:mono/diheme cytochrome c family protein